MLPLAVTTEGISLVSGSVTVTVRPGFASAWLGGAADTAVAAITAQTHALSKAALDPMREKKFMVLQSVKSYLLTQFAQAH